MANASASVPVNDAVKRRIVLVGAGHAHLYSLRRAASFARRGYELVVIAPEDFWYSGLATGVLGGTYPASLDRIDIAALLAGTGAQLIRKSMTGLDPANRRVLLDDGSSIGYGALSLNLGSTVPPIPGANENFFPAKPVTSLIALRTALEDAFGRKPPSAVSVAIAGGGITGCEIAASVAELAGRHHAPVNIVIYAGSAVLAGLPSAGATKLTETLRRNGIAVRPGARILGVEDARLTLADGTSEAFDYLVDAAGLEPPPLTRALGLPITDDGALIVDQNLMSPGANGVFAAGDCIAFRGEALPRVGVYAIRQSPVLFHNTMAFLEGAPLKSFAPQARYLSIMTLGNGEGFAQRSGFWWLGRAAFWLKDRIDRRFLRDHQPGAGNANDPPDPAGHPSSRESGANQK